MFARFLKNESGATAIEYGILAALMAIVVIGAVTAFAPTLKAAFTGIADGLSAAKDGLK